MIARLFVISPLALVAVVVFSSQGVSAQTISSGISGSLAEQSNTAGLDTNFSQGAELGQTSQIDVTDATRSDLSAGPMSANVNASSQSIAGNLSVAGAGDRPGATSGGSTGGRGGASSGGFAVAGLHSMGGLENGDGFGRSVGGTAFLSAGTPHMSGAKVEGPSTAAGRTGGTALGSQPTETGLGNGYAETASIYSSSAEDPVLDPVNGSRSQNVLGVPILIAASPTAEAASVFLSPDPVQEQYQFDDGVTPQFFIPEVPGRVLPTLYSASPPSNGFPDSTTGQAGLPLDTAKGMAPGSVAATTTPFPSVSEGTVFGIRGGISRDLFAAPRSRRPKVSGAQQDKLFLTRIMNGMDVSDAEAKRRQALAQHHGHGSIHDTPTSTTIH